MLDQLKSFDVDGMSVDQLIELSAYGRMMANEFTASGAETPEWLDQNLKSLRRELRTRQADAMDKNLREMKSRLESMLPAEERRKKLADQIAALEAKMVGV